MHVLRVGQYLALVNETLRAVPSDEIHVEGEVSDFRVAQQKWVSFDLKDEEEQAVLKCFMTVWQLQTPLEDGMKIRVRGYPKVYERFGTFKMNVTDVELVGEGALKRAYELLKKKLEAEGLFDVSRKRAIPRFPERIGLITSRDAAAYGDFLRILQNRWGGTDVLFKNVHVQGKEAVPEILAAIDAFAAIDAAQRPDVLVLVRGGGGLEDLHAFNDEAVARAVFRSSMPVVCGVGHERDESLCDFVADVRASTPSNAAERVVPSRQEVAYEIETMLRHMEARLMDGAQQRRHVVDRAIRRASVVFDQTHEHFQLLTRRLFERVEAWMPRLMDKVQSCERVLKNVDPTRVLSLGYSIVSVGGKVLTDVACLDTGSAIAVQLARGSFDANVKKIYAP